jgi:hypothetical protein
MHKMKKNAPHQTLSPRLQKRHSGPGPQDLQPNFGSGWNSRSQRLLRSALDPSHHPLVPHLAVAPTQAHPGSRPHRRPAGRSRPPGPQQQSPLPGQVQSHHRLLQRPPALAARLGHALLQQTLRCLAHLGQLAGQRPARRVVGWVNQAPPSPWRHRPAVSGPPDPPQDALLVCRPGAGLFLRRHGHRYGRPNCLHSPQRTGSGGAIDFGDGQTDPLRRRSQFRRLARGAPWSV